MNGLVRVTAVLAGMLVGCGVAAGQAAEVKGDAKALLGSANYVPSPERPEGWRGDGTGRYPGATPPLKWSRTGGGQPSSSGILWMTPVPAGGSSPIVVGDRLYVGFDPYGLMCISKTTGQILWYRTHHFYEVMPEEDRKKVEEQAAPIYGKIREQLDTEFKRMAGSVSVAGMPDSQRFMTGNWGRQMEDLQKKLDAAVAEADKAKYTAKKNSWEFAPATPVSDGKNVYMWFSNRVAVCYDLDGKRQWVTVEPGIDKTCGEHGRHSSPVLVGDRFIVQYANNVIGFDRKTGKPLWTQVMQAPHWATPTYSSLVTTMVEGAPYVISARGDGFRASDGELGWGPYKDYGGENTTAIVESGHIFLYDRSGIIQLLIPSPGPGAKPALGKSIKKSALPKEFYMVASPLMVDGLVYLVSDKGLLRVFDPVGGTILYEKPLPLDSHIEYVWYPGFAASPALGGKYIYLMDNQGGTVVIEPGKEYKELAANKISTPEKKNANEQTVANPVFDGKVIYVRGQQYMYCIGSR